VIFKIRHRTIYRFSREVFLEPHTIRLRPRCDPFQKLHDFRMSVTPTPAGSSEGYDAEGNQAAVVWFEEKTGHLEILAESAVETLRPNPFDFFITCPEALTLPVSYAPEDNGPLALYRRGLKAGAVRELAGELAAGAGQDTLTFLNELSSRVYTDWDVVIREEGDPLDPAQTLQRKEGSCRDLALLFMAVCREAGIASRFVSGYQEGDREQTIRYMHAWPEVYLPGAGWRGYDPTHGLAVSDRHVALAAGAAPGAAAPTRGSYRGSGVTSSMEVELSIETEP
jgi:transglutaminase-like putative cysteine protease